MFDFPLGDGVTWGTYSIAQHAGEEVYQVTTACPQCGQRRKLNHDPEHGHKIQSDGIVIGSYLCPDCGFHEHVRLLDWKNPGELR